MMKYLNLDY